MKSYKEKVYSYMISMTLVRSIPLDSNIVE